MNNQNNAPYTPELETPLGWMSPTQIDRTLGEIMQRKLAGAAPAEGDEHYKELQDIRRSSIYTFPGKTSPNSRRSPL